MTRNDRGQFDSNRELTDHTDLFNEYAGWLSAHTDNQTTVTRRKKGAEAWLSWCEDTGNDPLTAGEDTARAFVRSLVQEGLAETTISSRFASVSKFYHWLLTDSTREIEVEENPNTDISLPRDYEVSNSSHYVDVVHREGRQDVIAPSFDTLKPLFDHVPGERGFTKVRNELICRLFWQTALRSGELSRVRTDNVDLEKREIEIRSAKLNREDHPDLYHRRVFFESSLDYLYHRYLDKRQEKDPDGDCPYLLIGDKGDQLSPAYLSRIVKQAAHKAGIQEPLVTDESGDVQQWLFTAHRLRHARITHLCNKTEMDLNFIRMMAGHAQISTTLDYVNADWTEARDAYQEATEPGR